MIAHRVEPHVKNLHANAEGSRVYRRAHDLPVETAVRPLAARVGIGAAKGAAAGAAAAATAAVWLLAINAGLDGAGDAKSLQEGVESLFEALIALILLPAVTVAAGLIVAALLRLQGWWAVGLVAPLLGLSAVSPLGDWPVLAAIVGVAVYAAVGAASTAIYEWRAERR
jgi:hypothetical protein